LTPYLWARVVTLPLLTFFEAETRSLVEVLVDATLDAFCVVGVFSFPSAPLVALALASFETETGSLADVLVEAIGLLGLDAAEDEIVSYFDLSFSSSVFRRWISFACSLLLRAATSFWS
jgi:hypothetical protein